MSSETGVVELEPEDIEFHGRLEPGKMFLVNMEEGRIINDEEIKAANDAIDFCSDRITPGQANRRSAGSTFLQGQGRPGLRGTNLLDIEKPHCEIFRRLLAHPRVQDAPDLHGKTTVNWPDPGPGNASAQFNELADRAEDASIEDLEMSHRYGPATLCR